MALPSFFKRKAPQPASPATSDPSGEDTGPVQLARTRARRRLIGAVVLLAIGVIGFPMLFETQPRPLPGNIPIELPRRDAQTPRPVALPSNAAAVTELPPVVEAPPAPSSAAAQTGDGAADPSATAPPAAAPPAAVPAPVVQTASAVVRAASRAELQNPAPTVASRPASSPPKPAAAAPASAAGDPADSKAGRFVVQVGAYTDANALRDVRIKVEKLGLKTYTQSIETDAGKRTRVRVGPFATRQEADSASAKLKAAGLPGNVLVL